jgi:hypothetical protein
MPSTSKKQHNFMAAAAHNPAFAKKVGISQTVAKEFNQADKGRKFGSGGMKPVNMKKNSGLAKLPTAVRNKMGFMKKGGMAKSDAKEDTKMDKKQDKAMIKKAFSMHDKQEHKGEHTNLSKLKGGGMAKETMGPRTMAKDVEKGSNKLTKFGESAVQKRGHTKGTEERGYKIEKIQGGAKGGKGTFGAAPIKMARGGGIEAKGKTKGTMVKMCMGGRTGKK